MVRDKFNFKYKHVVRQEYTWSLSFIQSCFSRYSLLLRHKYILSLTVFYYRFKKLIMDIHYTLINTIDNICGHIQLTYCANSTYGICIHGGYSLHYFILSVSIMLLLFLLLKNTWTQVAPELRMVCANKKSKILGL